jgi:hypothetical protein
MGYMTEIPHISIENDWICDKMFLRFCGVPQVRNTGLNGFWYGKSVIFSIFAIIFSGISYYEIISSGLMLNN